MLTDFGRWCDECGQEFATQDDWDRRHDSGELDFHEECCPECKVESNVQVIDHGTHYTVELTASGENLGATVGHSRFITRSGAEAWAQSFRGEYDQGLR